MRRPHRFTAADGERKAAPAALQGFERPHRKLHTFGLESTTAYRFAEVRPLR